MIIASRGTGDAHQRRSGLRLATLVCALVGVLAAAEASEPGPTPGSIFVSEVLSNGMRVSILADPHQPLIATQIWYHVGSADEDARSRGLAHLFEHLMFGPTAEHGDRELWELHHRHGGDNNAYTTADETVYTSAIAPGAHREVLALEADRMRNLRLEPAALANEKKIVTEELRLGTENDPVSRVFIAAQAALLGEHPYAHDPSGSKEDIAAATVESCLRFYDDHYHPNRAHLVVVGPVDPEAVLRDARDRFGPIEPGGTMPVAAPSLTEWAFPPEIELREDLPPVETAVIGYPMPPADSEDNWALEVLAQLLAGGAVDPFEDELVNRRNKAVAAGTEWLAFRRGGALLFYSASLPYRRKSTAFRLMDRTIETLARLDWLNAESLAAAKRTLLRQDLESAYDAELQAEAIGTAQWHLGDSRLAFERAARIEAVTEEQVADAFCEYVAERRPVRLYVRPEKVPLHVRLFGWLYPLVSR